MADFIPSEYDDLDGVITIEQAGTAVSLTLTKEVGSNTISCLDIINHTSQNDVYRVQCSGDHVGLDPDMLVSRFRQQGEGAITTQTFVLISGSFTVVDDDIVMTPSDPSGNITAMLDVWADIVSGPCVKTRTAPVSGSGWHYEALDVGGNSVFMIDQFGELEWASTQERDGTGRPITDTNLYRVTAGQLKTDGTLFVGNQSTVGGTSRNINLNPGSWQAPAINNTGSGGGTYDKDLFIQPGGGRTVVGANGLSNSAQLVVRQSGTNDVLVAERSNGTLAFKVDASSNASFAGTLGVTGAATFSSSVTATGIITSTGISAALKLNRRDTSAAAWDLHSTAGELSFVSPDAANITKVAFDSRGTITCNGINGNVITLGSVSGTENFPGLWFGNTAPSLSNFAILADVSAKQTIFNAPSGGSVAVRVGNVGAALFSTSAVNQFDIAAQGATFGGTVAAVGKITCNSNDVKVTIGNGAGASNPGIWFTNATPDFTNFAFLGSGTTSVVNAPSGGSIDFRLANASQANVNASGIVLGPSGARFKKDLTGSATLDFGSIAANSTAELTITVTGAAAGDRVRLGPPATIEAGLVWCGRVSAPNTVTVTLGNVTTGAIDPASATWTADVRNYT